MGDPGHREMNHIYHHGEWDIMKHLTNNAQNHEIKAVFL